MKKHFFTKRPSLPVVQSGQGSRWSQVLKRKHFMWSVGWSSMPNMVKNLQSGIVWHCFWHETYHRKTSVIIVYCLQPEIVMTLHEQLNVSTYNHYFTKTGLGNLYQFSSSVSHYAASSVILTTNRKQLQLDNFKLEKTTTTTITDRQTEQQPPPPPPPRLQEQQQQQI